MLPAGTVGAGKNLPLPFEEAGVLLLDDGVTLTGCRPEFLGVKNAGLPLVVEEKNYLSSSLSRLANRAPARAMRPLASCLAAS